MRAGLRGLEVWRPKGRRESGERLESVCQTPGLLMSGGSDWHSPDGGTALGDFAVAGEKVAALLEAGGMRAV
jgi:hypothetical protein